MLVEIKESIPVKQNGQTVHLDPGVHDLDPFLVQCLGGLALPVTKEIPLETEEQLWERADKEAQEGLSDFCQAVKGDGATCGREMPCGYHRGR